MGKAASDGDTVIIKKYANRRLYNTESSSYITLEDVRQLILDGVAFQVCDARTGEDLTRQVLLQVIAEHEQGDEALLTPPLLMRLVRLYGDPRQVEIAPCLEQALDRLAVEASARALAQASELSLLNFI